MASKLQYRAVWCKWNYKATFLQPGTYSFQTMI